MNNNYSKILNRQEIEKFIKEKGLLEGYLNIDIQLTPNGFDFTAASICGFDSCGAVDFSNKERSLPRQKEIEVIKNAPEDKFGWWDLKRGAYLVKTNEIVSLPADLIGIAFPRSSLLRMGAFTHTGVWDAGFKGKSEFILVVENPAGVKIKQNARLVQILFMKIDETQKQYNGIYQNKN